jgi:hypothetical protein
MKTSDVNVHSSIINVLKTVSKVIFFFLNKKYYGKILSLRSFFDDSGYYKQATDYWRRASGISHQATGIT